MSTWSGPENHHGRAGCCLGRGAKGEPSSISGPRARLQRKNAGSCYAWGDNANNISHSALILNITAPDTGHTTVQCQCRGKARPLREPSRLPLPRPRTEHHDGDASSHCLGSGRLGQPFRPGGLLILPDGPGALVANLDLPGAAGSGRGT